MANELQDFRIGAATVPIEGAPPAAAPLQPGNPLDSAANGDVLRTLEGWYCEQVDHHAENRREQLIDCDYYDREQIDPRTRAELAQRNQNPGVYDLIHPVIDWIVGTERRTRVDWGVYPRAQGNEQTADVKEELLKFVSDATGAAFERSVAFKDAVKAGVGWIREYPQLDKSDGIPIDVSRIDWKRVRWDGFSRDDTLKDCRSINIEWYLDLDYAQALFPTRAQELRSASEQMIEPGLELLTEDLLLPQMFYNQSLQMMSHSVMGGTMSLSRRNRPRVRIIETEWRRPVVSRLVKMLVSGYTDLNGQLYDPKDGDMKSLLDGGKITLSDKIEDKIWHSIWCPGFLLANAQSALRHNKFSMTPIWGFRRHRDGMPYGLIRGLRDPQDEYNKRRSKAIFAACTNQVHYEAGAIETDKEEDVLEEAARPDGQIRLAEGALQHGRFKIVSQLEVGNANLALMKQAKDDVYEGSGVTRDNLGVSQTDQSGRAILAKQQQGAVTTAELFDNYRRSIQISGQKTLSLTEQFLTQPMEVRVVGNEGVQWLSINKPAVDPLTGQIVFSNDITADEADFVVDQQDYRETVRMAMAEMLFDTISKMPAELGIQLMDLAVDMTDVPNRAEIVQRIREINGQAAKGKPATPEEQAQQAAAAQQQQEDRELAVGQAKANIAKTTADAGKASASAAKLSTEDKSIGLNMKGDALNIAGMLHAALPLAPAADRLAAIPAPAASPTPPLPQPAQSAPQPVPAQQSPPTPGVPYGGAQSPLPPTT